ncbi:hypothetical protein [Arthrobacter sp. ISL-65]|uniref:competence protein CoiA family protein n=1 Tax=Arthrobacter sp. ISL-65 TaxID=2819112 RepID=UPI001BE8E4BE|nr:hypothetical protein [Arthrobacter sp. ISL-65]MBT2547642.1 hypothetical protein [Arthrobacter sp. ISL-65]
MVSTIRAFEYPTINAVPGWLAEVEHAHPERAWIADVMAIHASGKRLAFEVQLSPQNEDEYIRRSQRYADDRVGAVWIVPDTHDWFRVQVPMIVTGFGKTSDLPGAPGSLMDLAHSCSHRSCTERDDPAGNSRSGHSGRRFRSRVPGHRTVDISCVWDLRLKYTGSED